MSSRTLLVIVSLIFSLNACSSGKKAFERGDYFDAVLKSVYRLQQRPNHSKSQEALRMSYPLALDFLESQATNAICSDAPFKWKRAMNYYNLINYLHDKIKKSPASLKIVPKPVNKYSEISDLKRKAAEESYEAGIQSMMKNTRQDAIRAYYLFREANELEPGIKDVVEYQYQAEFNATLRVVYSQSVLGSEWVSVEPIVNSLNIPFIKFYTTEEIQRVKVPIHQAMLIEVIGYKEDKPTTTKVENSYMDSVKVEEISGGKKVIVKKAVNAKSILYEKKATSQGTVRIRIKEMEASKQLIDDDFTGTGVWSDTWATCSGDSRVIPEHIRELCSKSETTPDYHSMLTQARKDVLNQIRNSLSTFYGL